MMILHEVLVRDAFVVEDAADGVGEHCGNGDLLNLCAAV